ncbi:MAG: dihydroneopterin aldolase [Acidimicrobiia bacterium]|nr:dihydroneopterin aldolase [Acidimicrobiia bacterium]
MTDCIRLRGIEVFAYHGVLADEQEHGQIFVVDVDVFLDLSKAAASDDLAATVHYGELAQAIHDRVAEERWDLIERVAGRVADLVLEDERVHRVTVTVHKPSAPISVPFSDVAVTVKRPR